MKDVSVSFDELLQVLGCGEGKPVPDLNRERCIVYLSFGAKGLKRVLSRKHKYAKQLEFEAVNGREMYIELNEDDKVVGIEFY